MIRRGIVGAVVAAVLAATGLGNGPATADDTLPAPVLTSPIANSLVAGSVDLTATAESPYVVFELVGSGVVVRRTPVAADGDGVFRDTLPALGLQSPFSTRARACADASLASCTTPSAVTRLRRAVPRLVATETLPSTVLDPAVVHGISLQATGLAGASASVSGAGVPSTTVHDGDVVDVDVPALSDGRQQVVLEQCNPLNESACTRTSVGFLVRRALNLDVFDYDLFLNQNDDGLWETATALVFVDLEVQVSARWRILSSTGDTVAGPYELTEDEVAQGRQRGAEVVIDPRARLGHPLPAGHYRFEVETTSTVAGFDKSARKSVPLVVSNAPRVTTLNPITPAFYTWQGGQDVPDRMRVGPALDPDEVRLGSIGYRIIKQDGQLLGDPGMWFLVDPADPVVTWDGTTYEGGHPGTAPEGTYRIELIRHGTNAEGQYETFYGPVSAPFVLHRDLPPIVRARVTATARASWQRIIVEQGGRARWGHDGSVRFDRRPGHHGAAAVTTLHSLRVSTHRLKAAYLDLRLSGAWGRFPDVDVLVITPDGRTRAASRVAESATGLDFFVLDRWVRADGTLRFKVRWRGHRGVRMDRVVVRYDKYDLP